MAPQNAAARLLNFSPLRPRLALVLGSGFQSVLDCLDNARAIPYSRLPGFPTTGITGHQGNLFFGQLGGTPVLVLSGRAHYYEGHDLPSLTFPIRVLAEFGISDLLLTNAAGGIRRSLKPGDFMAFEDHLNFMGANPLRGAQVSPGKTRFVDLSDMYAPELRRLLAQAAKLSGVTLSAGVYLAVSGPSYETPAEIRAFARWGADAVGMSTVPEAIVARQCGLRVAALSCITNRAAGLGGRSLSHEHVLRQSEKVKASTQQLLVQFATLYGPHR
jgi:purine-nucleoside phosphorylase